MFVVLRRGAAAVGVASAAAAFALHSSSVSVECSASSFASCAVNEPRPVGNRVVGTMKDGQPVVQRTLRNGPLTVRVIDFGATVTSVLLPDKEGVAGEVTLGFNELEPYLDGRSPYFGCVAGRYANRIAKGKFQLDGKTHQLATNNGPNHLHGGNIGFDKQLWFCEAQSETMVRLALLSPDGDENYPGQVLARVTYWLPTPNELLIEYSATTNAPTPVNLTNHTYWNLKDGGKTDVLNHQVEIAADFYTPVDDTSIPTGEVRRVSGAMDLRKRVEIGKGVQKADNGGGYDHNYVIRGSPGPDGLRSVARVYEPASGRWMTVRSDQPGVQFYSGNYLDGVKGRDGIPYRRHHGFCLETQHFPDSVNHPHFPSTVLRPGKVYTHTTVHTFGTSPTAPSGPF